jgi:hypothetical protein
MTGSRGFASVRREGIRLFKPFRSMARVGVLPDLSQVRPTGARVAVRPLAVLCRATSPALTRSLSELVTRFEWPRRSGPRCSSEVVKPSPAPTAAVANVGKDLLNGVFLGGRGAVDDSYQ